MIRNRILPLGAIFAASILSTSALAAPKTMMHHKKMMSAASYNVVFVPTFTPNTHPYQYMSSGKKVTHFSPMIGVTHNRGYALFRIGRKPTPGLELLSERGMPTGLMKEFAKARMAGKVGTSFKSMDRNDGPAPKVVEMHVNVNKKFPYVSVAAMIAPSPDWFVAVRNVKLTDRSGAWKPSVVMKAYAYDSGGDKGKNYTSKDMDTMPKQPTKYAKTKHFVHKGSLNPIGVFVFSRAP